jgi:hypothetical protein
MKTSELADLLTGLSSFLEKHLKQDAARDLRTVSECFRGFGDQSLSAFCQFVTNAKNGGAPARPPRATATDPAKVGEVVTKIQHFLSHQDTYDHPSVRDLAEPLKKLKNQEIQSVGERIGCPVKGTKTAMIERIRDWLVGIKASADQSSFSLSGTSSG